MIGFAKEVSYYLESSKEQISKKIFKIFRMSFPIWVLSMKSSISSSLSQYLIIYFVICNFFFAQDIYKLRLVSVDWENLLRGPFATTDILRQHFGGFSHRSHRNNGFDLGRLFWKILQVPKFNSFLIPSTNWPKCSYKVIQINFIGWNW